MKKGNMTILASIFAMLMVAGSVGAGMMAYFSDVETSSGNVFTAGVIDLEIDSDGDAMWGPMDDPLDKFFEYMPINDIKPGDSGEVTISLHLKAESNDADLYMTVTTLDNFGGLYPEPEEEQELLTGVDDDIASEILVLVWLDDGDNIWIAPEVIIHDGTLTDLVGLGKILIQADAEACITYFVGFSWLLPGGVGNEHQGDFCTFDIVFDAEQV